MENSNRELDKSFDDTYREKDEMFGHPYQELQDYFKSLPGKGAVLDLGCGQGRDSIFLASIGYKVTAVDSSTVGINQMLKMANEKGLRINGISADVFELELEETFDVILFDMLLHSFEKEQQTQLLEKYSKHLQKSGIICIVHPEDFEAEYFLNIFSAFKQKWELIDRITINDVPKLDDEGDYTFKMIVFQRSSNN